MGRPQPGATRTDPRLPYTTLFGSYCDPDPPRDLVGEPGESERRYHGDNPVRDALGDFGEAWVGVDRRAVKLIESSRDTVDVATVDRASDGLDRKSTRLNSSH